MAGTADQQQEQVAAAVDAFANGSEPVTGSESNDTMNGTTTKEITNVGSETALSELPPDIDELDDDSASKNEIEPNLYCSFDEFKILDELDSRFCFVDWTEGEKSFMWGNRAHLECYNMTQEELNNWNFKDQSAAANEYHRSVYQAVQVEKGHIEKLKTAYPKGKPVTAIQSFRPIELHLPKWEEPRTVMLMELKEPMSEAPAPVGQTREGSNRGGDKAHWGLAEEMLRYTEVIAMMFDLETEKLEFENQSCKAFYEHLNATSPVVNSRKETMSVTSSTSNTSGQHRLKRKLEDVFDTCVWEDAKSKAAALRDVRALTITSGRLEFECQKVPQGQGVDYARDAIWHKLQVIPCLNPQTGKSALIVNEYDVTALKFQADLIAASRSQEQFFAAVSHELRTPLNGIIGLSGSLIQNSACTEQMTKTLKLIQSSGQRLAGLVNDILDAASAKNNTFSIKHEMLELWEISQSVVEVLSPLIRADRVTLVNKIAPNSIPHMEGDSGRVNQILTNLVSNAIKFTDRGTISLSAKVLKDKEVLVEVSDTGIGIPENKLDQVWAPFKQVDMSTTRKYGGTGLGLSLVKELVEAHHGRVGVTSQHGVQNTGSTFFFVLPLRQPKKDNAGGAAGGSKAEPGGSGEQELVKEYREAHLASVSDAQTKAEDLASVTRGDSPTNAVAAKRAMHHSDLYDSFEILSVDDNLVNHIVVENSLVPRGYKVTTCMSGPEALELIDSRGFLPDLILLDCMMPTMSGCEMCERLRLNYPCNTLPVIMVSAKDQEDDIVKGLKSGCNDYLAKPYGVNELNARIDVQLKLKYLWHLEIQRMLSDRSAILQVPQALTSGGELSIHERTTVLVCDVQDMLMYVQKLPPKKMAEIINSLYDALDDIAVQEGANRVLDDSYMVVVGDDKMSPETQTRRILQIAKKMLEAAQEIKVQMEGHEDPVRLRIGIATGKAYSCMVGLQMPYYTYFGKVVRDACEVCALGQPGCAFVTAEVQQTISANAEDLLMSFPLSENIENSSNLCPYIAKIGDYVLAVDEAERKPFGSMSLQSAFTKPGKAEAATSHLRAFLRLSMASEGGTPKSYEGNFGSRGRESEYGAQECPSCLELRVKVQELDEKLKVSMRKEKKMRSEAASSELTRTPSTAIRHTNREEIEILSVDDDPVNQMVVENLLLPVGYKVTACMDGIEALQHIMGCSRLPDLVMLDVMMPEMSGIQVCERIREMYNRTTLPVIMVSARSSVECIVEGLEAGCNDYVSKPFNRVELLARISTQLRVRDAARAEVDHVRSDKLLRKMLPEHVIAKLTINPSLIVEEHRSVSMLFSSIVGYSTLTSTLPTMELIQMLNGLNSAFDDLCDKHGCFKVDTMEDTYVVVAGHENGEDDHANLVLRMALDMIDAVKKIEYPRHPGKHLQVRIGIHTGGAYAGVVGNKMLRYCFFGDTVTIARGMENTGFAMNVQVSAATKEKLGGRWELLDTGMRKIKDQGNMQAFVIKESRCAWESALKKAELVVLDQSQQSTKQHSSTNASFATMLHSSNASFNIKHPGQGEAEPDRRMSVTQARRASMSSDERHLLQSMEAVASDTHETDLQIVKEKLSNFVSTKRSMPPALTPPIHSPPRSVVDGPAGSVSGVTMAVAQKLEMERKDNEIHDLELKQEQTSGQIIQAERKIKDLERMLAEALLKSQTAEDRLAEAAEEAEMRFERLEAEQRQRHRQAASEWNPQQQQQQQTAHTSAASRCARCKENAARAEDAMFALEMARADNSKLISTCALLSQQAQRDEAGMYSHSSGAAASHPVAAARNHSAGAANSGSGRWGGGRAGGSSAGEQSLVNLFVQQQSMIFDRLESNSSARAVGHGPGMGMGIGGGGAGVGMISDGGLLGARGPPLQMQQTQRRDFLSASHLGGVDSMSVGLGAHPDWETPATYNSAPAARGYSGVRDYIAPANLANIGQDRGGRRVPQRPASVAYIPSPDDIDDGMDEGPGQGMEWARGGMHGRRN